MSFGGSAFGSGFANTPFGVSSSSFGGASSTFGASQPSLFASAPTFGASSSVFGSSNPLFGTSAPAFGVSTPNANAFGVSASAFGAASPAAFGSTAPALAASTSAFGVSAPAFGASTLPFGASSSAFSAPVSAFGPTSADGPAPSTRAVKWMPTQLNDSGTNTSDAGRYIVLSAMDNYRHFSLEELRFGDYQRADKGGEYPPATFNQTGNTPAPQSFGSFGAQPQQQPTGGTGGASLFGSTPQQSSSLFGSTSFGSQPSSAAFGVSAPAFGATASLFGTSTPAFGASSSAFGANSSLFAASSSAFGSSAPAFGSYSSSGFGMSTPAFGASASGFGAASAPSSGLFGASKPSTGFSGFGASSQSLFGAPAQSASLFGGGASSAGGLFTPAAGTFGSSSAATLGGFGSFGTQSAPSLFGNPASAAAFGNTPQSAASLFAGGFGGGASSASPFASSSSLFAQSGFGSSFGAPSAPLFGGFGASSQGLFGSSSFSMSQPWGSNASSASLFNFSSSASSFGHPAQLQGQQALQQISDGPLLANLTDNPFGESKLVAGAAASMSTASQAEVGLNTGAALTGQSASSLSVIVGKTSNLLDAHSTKSVVPVSDFTRPSSALVTKGDGRGWFMGSPMRPWGRSGSLFNVNTVLRGGYSTSGRNQQMLGFSRSIRNPNQIIGGSHYAPWRTEEQMIQAANIKKLVIEPLSEEELQRRERRREIVRERGRERKKRSSAGSEFVVKENDDSVRQDEQRVLHVATSAIPKLASGAVDKAYDDREDRADLGDPDMKTDVELVRKQIEPSTRVLSKKRLQGDDASTAIIGNGEASLHGELDDKMRGGVDAKDNAAPVRGDNDTGGALLSKLVSYRDLYQWQMSAKRRESIGENPRGAGEGQNPHDMESRLNTILPICTKEGAYMVPSLPELRTLTEEELARVSQFTYGLTDVGELTWEEPVDVRGLDLDKLVRMRPREVCVYPDEEELPPVGQGLNKPAIVRLHRVWKFDKRSKKPVKDASAAAHIVSKLKKHCDREGLEFRGYDVSTGTWTFRAAHF